MFKKSFLVTALLLILLSLLAALACSSQSSSDGAVARQSSINAQLNGDTIAIAQSDVDRLINTRFSINAANATLSFMAYIYNDQLQVRADICPPCRSDSFTLTQGTLVCDTCGTVFNAQTGAGIRGACVKFAKQSVPYEIKDGNIVMKGTDLLTAFQNTLNPSR